MFVYYVCCVLSGRGLYYGPIPRPEVSYLLCVCVCVCVCIHIYTHRVSQEECVRFRENVPYVKVHRYNPKHPYPKLNGYGDNGKRNLIV